MQFDSRVERRRHMNMNLEVSTFLLTLNCYTEVVSSLVVAFFSVNDFANGIKKEEKLS